MNQKTTSRSSSGYDYSKINALCKYAMQYLDEIYSYFGISAAYKNEILVKSVCPIHGGDNDTALNMYYNGDYKVHYKCRTHQCEEIFGNGFIGFIKGCISRTKYGWEKEGDKEATFKEAVNFLTSFLKQDLSKFESSSKSVEKMKFGAMVNAISSDAPKKSGITRELYRSRVQVPCDYYVKRGFSAQILDEYDVGYCNNPNKPMFGRAVVPIYDNNHEFIVGCTGRSVFEKCPKCSGYHDPNKKCHHSPKWLHSKGFQKQKWLYNYWTAKEHISKTGVAILVESPGNVWRLAEAGIRNVVAIFGTAFNNDQKNLLDESGALSLICLMDNDEAGKKAAKKIEEQCSRLYRIYFPSFDASDIAELNVDKVTSDIKPFIENAMNIYKEI